MTRNELRGSMNELYVVVEANAPAIYHEQGVWAYGIFNNRDEAEGFVAWVTKDNEFQNEEEYVIVEITPATRHGLL